jgi:Cell division GTPase
MEDRIEQAQRKDPGNESRDKTTDSEMDEQLRELIEERQADIKVIGSGGAGNNTVSRLVEVGIEGCETIAMNTDAQDLLHAKL